MLEDSIEGVVVLEDSARASVEHQGLDRICVLFGLSRELDGFDQQAVGGVHVFRGNRRPRHMSEEKEHGGKGRPAHGDTPFKIQSRFRRPDLKCGYEWIVFLL